jgi:hypothetical protein
MNFTRFNVHKHGRSVNGFWQRWLCLKTASFISARIGRKAFIPERPPLPFFFCHALPQGQIIRFHCCASKFGALASTYLSIPPQGMSPRWPLPFYCRATFLSPDSAGMNVPVECHSLDWCRSSVLRCDAGMVWKGLAWRSPFQICPILRIVGLSGTVLLLDKLNILS